MSRDRKKFNKAAYVAAAACSGMFALGAHGATSFYFDYNGTSSGLGSPANNASLFWDVSGTNGAHSWNSSSTGSNASTTWAAGDFARFTAGASGTAYTVKLTGDVSDAGLFETISGINLTISQNTVNGTLDITSVGSSDILGVSGGNSGGKLQGILISGSTSSVNITAPISGQGGVEQQLAGALSLYGNNSYSGGTMTTGGQVTNYNNNNSFGTGPIYFAGTSGQGIVKNGASVVTIANNVSFLGSVDQTNHVYTGGNTTTNFVSGHGATAAAPGAIWTGTVTLPTSAGTTTLQTGNSTADVTEFRGVISGPVGDAIAIANSGTIIFSGANNYAGPTSLLAGVLKLGASNTIATTASISLSGGTLDPDGLLQNMSNVPLILTANSTIDYEAGASEVDFANSASQAWTAGKVLNLANWNPSIDKLRFDSGPAGLTSGQLAQIEFNGDSSTLGTAQLDANGYVTVPEPTSLGLIGVGALGLMRKRRSKEA